MAFPLEQWIKQVREIAIDAGSTILEIYGHDFSIEHKADDSPLTEADLAAHRIIVEGLTTLSPSLPVLSEESDKADLEQRRQWAAYWLVDPLDGTREFVNRNGEFTVNIALVVGHELKLGVVYAPVLNTLYAAAEGVYCRKATEFGEQDIHVSATPSDPLRVVGSRSHASESLGRYLKALGPHSLRSMGSSLKICLVAEGSADLYPRLGPTSEWDTAAAQCIVEQAGGKVMDTDGQALRYNTRASLRNPHFLVVADGHYDWLTPLSASHD